MKKNILLGFVLVAVIAVGAWFYFNMDNAVSYITISINPEVELMLDKDNKVLSYLALNEDADVLMSDLDVVGLSVEEAMDLIIDSATEAGFIDEFSEENAIMLKTMNDDEETRVKLEEKIMAHVQTHLEEKKVFAVLAAVKLGEALKIEAESFDISNGKMLLVEEALVLDPSLIKEDLVKMEVKDIQAIIKDIVKTRHEALNEDEEELKTLWQSKKEELKTTYKEEIDALKEQYKEEIANYNNLTAVEKVAKIKEVVAAKKEVLQTKLTELKEEVKNYIENGQYNSVNVDIVESVRAAIKNRGN